MREASLRAKFSFLIHDVSRMRRVFFDQALKPLGATRAQWWALGNISRHAKEGMIQTKLADIMETGKVSVGGLIDRLQDAGLVYRQSDKVDRRIKRIFITDKGFEVLDQIALAGEQLDDLLFKDISEKDLTIAANVLARLKENVRHAVKEPVAVRPPSQEGTKPQSQTVDPQAR